MLERRPPPPRPARRFSRMPRGARCARAPAVGPRAETRRQCSTRAVCVDGSQGSRALPTRGRPWRRRSALVSAPLASHDDDGGAPRASSDRSRPAARRGRARDATLRRRWMLSCSDSDDDEQARLPPRRVALCTVLPGSRAAAGRRHALRRLPGAPRGRRPETPTVAPPKGAAPPTRRPRPLCAGRGTRPAFFVLGRAASGAALPHRALPCLKVARGREEWGRGKPAALGAKEAAAACGRSPPCPERAREHARRFSLFLQRRTSLFVSSLLPACSAPGGCPSLCLPGPVYHRRHHHRHHHPPSPAPPPITTTTTSAAAHHHTPPPCTTHHTPPPQAARSSPPASGEGGLCAPGTSRLLLQERGAAGPPGPLGVLLSADRPHPFSWFSAGPPCVTPP